MAKSSSELVSARREEIIKVCEDLYRYTGMKDISLKRIGDETSLTRTAIYNYFKTKEDIFIVMLQREFEMWTAQLEAAGLDRESFTAEEMAGVFAGTLEKRSLLLRLINVEWADLISNSSPECLDELRLTYGDTVKATDALLSKLEPPMTESERVSFTTAFFPFIYGIYPCAFVDEEHREALEEVGISHIFRPVYELVYNCVKDLINIRTCAVTDVQPAQDMEEPELEPTAAEEPESHSEQEPEPEPEPETIQMPEPEPVVTEKKKAKPPKPKKPLSEYRWQRKSHKRCVRGKA